MRLAEPGWLVLLVLTPLPWLFSRRRGRVSWPTLDGFKAHKRRGRRLSASPDVLRGLVVVCLAVGLARPQTAVGRLRLAGQGVAIVLAVDQSSSMNTPDFPTPGGPVSRLAAARATLARFITARGDDLVGVVAFANYPDLTCPPTLDHAFLLDAVRALRPAKPGDDGTNLGDAMVLGLDALTGISPEKKVLILLTDGRNSPAVPSPEDPEDAAGLARALGVTVHTIAVGKARPDADGPEAEGPDFGLLERLAGLGGGRAFVAGDAGSLDAVFEAIDALEKSPVRGEVLTRYREDYAVWAAAAFGLIAADRWLAAGRLRRLP